MFNRVAELEEKIEKLEHKVTELEKAAELGRAVRRMPELYALWKGNTAWYCEPESMLDEPFKGDTPEAALRAAGLMEEKIHGSD